MKLKKALELASRVRFRHVLMIGDQELAEGKYPLRDMTQGTQKTVTKEELFELFAGQVSELSPALEPVVRPAIAGSPQAEKGTPTR